MLNLYRFANSELYKAICTYTKSRYLHSINSQLILSDLSKIKDIRTDLEEIGTLLRAEIPDLPVSGCHPDASTETYSSSGSDIDLSNLLSDDD